jgi:2',3'-cyclic-nucleotide 2'-phosphodiesterase (5'-nucleotidase family)
MIKDKKQDENTLQKDKKFAKIEKILLKKPMMIIIHVTDTYFIEETQVNNKVDLPGFARFYALGDFIKSRPQVQENNIPVLVLHGGDFLFPSLMSAYFKGKQMVDVLNACGFDYCTIGNHDFDEGARCLNARMAKATFGITCANIKPKKNHRIKIRDHVICHDKENNPFAAIVGVAGADTIRNATQNGFETLHAENALRKVMRGIMQAHPKIDHLVVLSHMSNKEDKNLHEWLDKNWDGYAYILGGHDHNEILQYDDKYPRTVLVKGQSNCRTVQILGLYGKSKDRDLGKNVLVFGNELSKINPNQKIQKIVTKWEALLEEHIKEKESDEVIKQFKPGTTLDATELHLRKGSTNFGNFIADCMSEFAKSDIALINSGHFRGDRKIGSVLKVSDIRRIFVLDKKDALVKITMSGAECRDFLRHAYSEEGRGKVLQISRDAIKVLQNSSAKDKFSVAMLWDMLSTDDDGFTTILAKCRATTVSKIRSEIKKSVIADSSLFDVIKRSSECVRYDPNIRISIKKFPDIFKK